VHFFLSNCTVFDPCEVLFDTDTYVVTFGTSCRWIVTYFGGSGGGAGCFFMRNGNGGGGYCFFDDDIKIFNINPFLNCCK